MVRTSFTDKPSPGLRVFIFLCWLKAVIFLFGLPLWSWLFNDAMGYGKALCHHDASAVVCGNTNQSYIDNAHQNKRERTYDGAKFLNHSYWGCGCGEGIFGDWACVVATNEHNLNNYQTQFLSHSFSVSYYITTPSATGIFCAATFFPMLFIWNFGAGTIKEYNGCGGQACGERTLFVTQVIFQIFFGAFLFFNVCAFPKTHGIVVSIFVASQVVHMCTVAAHLGCKTARGKFVLAVSFLAFFALAVGEVVDYNGPQQDGSWFVQHAFFLGEVTGLSAILSIPVILTVFWQEDEDGYKSGDSELDDEESAYDEE